MEFDHLVKDEEIRINYRVSSDGDWNVLVEVLQKSKVLKNLHLNGDQITLSDGKITNAIAHNRTLQCLHLKNNKIGPEGAKKLAAALKNNKTLQKLNLHNNQIGDEGIKSIADALMGNSALQKIDLGYTNMGDEGAESLAASFLVNESLRKIWLVENKISDKGAEKMTEALQCNNTIEYLDLAGNANISKKVKDKIEAMIKDPNRKAKHAQKLELKQLMDDIARKDDKISSLQKEIANKDAEIASKYVGISSKDAEMAVKDAAILSKDQEIATLKAKGMDNIGAILRDPNRKAKNAQKLELKQLLDDIASKDYNISCLKKEIANKDVEISSKDAEMAVKDAAMLSKDQEIATLKVALESPLRQLISSQNENIANLKARLKDSIPFETVDSRSYVAESSTKRSRTNGMPTSSLDVLRRQNQKMVQVKREKYDVETALKTVEDEKKAVEANLENVQEEFEIATETVGQQLLTTDILQGRIDELVALFQAGQADGATIAEIRGRSLASGS